MLSLARDGGDMTPSPGKNNHLPAKKIMLCSIYLKLLQYRAIFFLRGAA